MSKLTNDDYYLKYLKYKEKYFKLKQNGGVKEKYYLDNCDKINQTKLTKWTKKTACENNSECTFTTGHFFSTGICEKQKKLQPSQQLQLFPQSPQFQPQLFQQSPQSPQFQPSQQLQQMQPSQSSQQFQQFQPSQQLQQMQPSQQLQQMQPSQQLQQMQPSQQFQPSQQLQQMQPSPQMQPSQQLQYRCDKLKINRDNTIPYCTPADPFLFTKIAESNDIISLIKIIAESPYNISTRNNTKQPKTYTSIVIARQLYKFLKKYNDEKPSNISEFIQTNKYYYLLTECLNIEAKICSLLKPGINLFGLSELDNFLTQKEIQKETHVNIFLDMDMTITSKHSRGIPEILKNDPMITGTNKIDILGKFATWLKDPNISVIIVSRAINTFINQYFQDIITEWNNIIENNTNLIETIIISKIYEMPTKLKYYKLKWNINDKKFVESEMSVSDFEIPHTLYIYALPIMQFNECASYNTKYITKEMLTEPNKIPNINYNFSKESYKTLNEIIKDSTISLGEFCGGQFKLKQIYEFVKRMQMIKKYKNHKSIFLDDTKINIDILNEYIKQNTSPSTINPFHKDNFLAEYAKLGDYKENLNKVDIFYNSTFKLNENYII
jgi:hypothetical protein